MKILTIAFLINSLTALSVHAQEYLQYNTGDSSQIMEDINTLLTYRKWDEMKGEQPKFEWSYSKDKKDRKKYDSLSQIVSEKYFKGKVYRVERSLAVSRLLDRRFFHKELAQYKDQLIPSVWYDYIQYKGARSKYAKFLSLLELPQAKKDSLLADKETPLAVRARLGDKEAGQEIIDRFNEAFTNVESPYFEDKHELSHQLFYINTKASLDAFFEMIDGDRVWCYEYKCNDQVCLSDGAVAVDLISALSGYHPMFVFSAHPPIELIGQSYFIEREHPKAPGKYYFDYPELNMQRFYREVEKQIERLYGRKVTINPPYWNRIFPVVLEEW